MGLHGLSEDLWESIEFREFLEILGYLSKWFAGPDEQARYADREMGVCVGSLGTCRFRREVVPYEYLNQWFSKIYESFDRSNIFMSTAYFVVTLSEETALYDRVVYDFDCEQDPEKAVIAAHTFAKVIEQEYDATPIVALSGFKGAHVVVPLYRRTDWQGYKLLWTGLLDLLPKEYGFMVDTNMLQYNRLHRVPLTWNVKNGQRRFVRIVYPKEWWWSTFSWREVKALDPAKVRVYVADVQIPKTRVINLRASPRRYQWVEKVLKEGLPDGRKRFIFYVATAYLLTVKGLGEEEAMQIIKDFLEASCREHGKCDKVYDSWIRNNMKYVKQRNLMPTSLAKIQEKDPELYNLIKHVLEKKSTQQELSQIC